MITVFLCEGNADECWNCGGWVHAGDPPEVPVGEEPIGGHYCSIECHDEATRFQALADARRATDWCPACGFDNHEHADDCPDHRAAEHNWLHTMAERGEDHGLLAEFHAAHGCDREGG